MAFTNNRNVFYNNKSFDEKLFANGLGMGTPSFVCKGLELTGTTLTSGVFNNTGAYGILGLEGETHEIPANYTGFIVIKTTLNSQNGFNEIITSATKLDTDQRDTSNIKHFTIYELDAGVIVQDFRHINYVKSFYLKNMGGSNIAWVLNGFTSETFDASVLAGNRTVVSFADIGVFNDDIQAFTSTEQLWSYVRGKVIDNMGGDKPAIVKQTVFDLETNFKKVIDLFEADLIREENWREKQITGIDITFDTSFYTTNSFVSAVTYEPLATFAGAYSLTGEVYKFSLTQNDTINWALMNNGLYYGDLPEVLAQAVSVAFTTETIALSDSIYNFKNVICGFGPLDMSFQRFKEEGFPQNVGEMGFAHVMNSGAGIDNFASYFTITPNGLTLNKNTGTTQYTHRYSINLSNNTIVAQPQGSQGIISIKGNNRIYPMGTTHTFAIVDGKLERTVTYGDEVLDVIEMQGLGS